MIVCNKAAVLYYIKLVYLLLNWWHITRNKVNTKDGKEWFMGYTRIFSFLAVQTEVVLVPCTSIRLHWILNKTNACISDVFFKSILPSCFKATLHSLAKKGIPSPSLPVVLHPYTIYDHIIYPLAFDICRKLQVFVRLI